MAARRLIIVLLVLFGISVAAAAIAPDRQGGLIGASDSDSTSTSSSTSTSTSPAPATAAGESLTARIDASSARPETVEGFVGDQLELNVRSRNGQVIEIGEYGVTDFAAPNAPATFDLLLREPGRFPITDGDSGRIVGRLVVHKPAGHDNGRRQREQPRRGGPGALSFRFTPVELISTNSGRTRSRAGRSPASRAIVSLTASRRSGRPSRRRRRRS